jgi:hypothetical protein
MGVIDQPPKKNRFCSIRTPLDLLRQVAGTLSIERVSPPYSQTEKPMKVLVKPVTLSLLAVFISFAALAQQRDSPAKSSLGVPEAPVGHRQPTVSDAPEQRTSADAMLDKINRDLDKKLKSICRGC